VHGRLVECRPRLRLADASGVTLIELLVAVTILGLSVVSIAGMFIVMTSTTFLHKEQANVGAVLRSAAESVVATGYTCSNAQSTYQTAAASVSHPSVVNAPTVTSVTALDGVTAIDCSGGAQPLELVTVQVTSTELRVKQQLAVVKAPS
jgi:type II secretory pathway pseudopilin PulG